MVLNRAYWVLSDDFTVSSQYQTESSVEFGFFATSTISRAKSSLPWLIAGILEDLLNLPSSYANIPAIEYRQDCGIV